MYNIKIIMENIFILETANFNIIREGTDGQPGLEGSNGSWSCFTGDYSTTRTYTVQLVR